MNTYSMAVAKKTILLVPSPMRGGLGWGGCFSPLYHPSFFLPSKGRSQFKKAIFLTVGLFFCVAVSGWADNKSKTVGSEPVPIQNIAPQEKASTTAYEIDWTSINGGGELASTSTNYKIRASTAQSVIGESQSANYKMGIGFWFGTGLYCTSRPGDVNGDGAYTLPDIILEVNIVFKGASKPTPACRADANADNVSSLPDIIRLVNRVFKGGPIPPQIGVCCL